ncbi:S-adenosyl-L-methionine-dependent methyltransferase [Cinara cedri]|uniref:S-adenosyl-L-methionine-dependent methyltransferase n=1 Tax=Cinara cedri TaxID=506608 RepID=A0A5E4NH28_9HEMI|nr:S-adenosyl-L-methionine-dependent methyltransferase [Cinara cedri]
MDRLKSIYYRQDVLLNYLMDTIMIKNINEEKALRSVDIRSYFDIEEYQNQLESTKWLKIYENLFAVESLINLQLSSGHKFLNIGSGIGYISTLAGLLIGKNGVNHGIEVNERFVDLAREKLAEFNMNSAAIDHFDFCEPIFIHGNACELLSAGYYDRVYCEAAVPSDKLEFMKSLVKINGILVIPYKGFLWKMIRQNENEYNVKRINDILTYAFSDLIVRGPCCLTTVTFPPVKLLTLQELCRNQIRSSIRQNLQKERPELEIRTKCLDLNSEQPLVCEEDKAEEKFTFDVNFIDDYISFLEIMNRTDIHSIAGTSRIKTHTFGDLVEKNDKSGNDSIAKRENDSGAPHDTTIYHFIKDYRVNQLSRCLKEKIYSLSIPTQLKDFLTLLIFILLPNV